MHCYRILVVTVYTPKSTMFKCGMNVLLGLRIHWDLIF